MAPLMAPETRGKNWEWTEVNLNSVDWSIAWRNDHGFTLQSSIQIVTREDLGWTCLVDKPTYVVGIHPVDHRLLFMRAKKE